MKRARAVFIFYGNGKRARDFEQVIVHTYHERYRRPSMKTIQNSRAGGHFVRLVLSDYRIWLLAAVATVALISGFAMPVSYTNNAGAQGAFTGQWLIEFRPGDPDIQMTLRYQSNRSGHEYNNNTSFEVTPDQLQGLTREQAMSGGSHVQFQFKRDAGVFNCEGWFKNGEGAGHYTFSPSQTFAAELKSRGYDTPSAEQQFSMAMGNLSLALIEELKAQGYERPSLSQLIEMGYHGVRLEYVRGLKALGYTLRSVEDLIEMRDHGVTLSFIRELSALGYERLSPDALIGMKDHGVSTSFIKELKTSGYDKLSREQLVGMKDHGVSTEFIRELRALGYQQLEVEELIRMKDHGVSTEFIKEIKQLGYEHPTPDQLIRLRDHGVTAGFIQRMKERGNGNLSLEELVRLRDRGDGE
jgi:hypothetical protein